jgi:integrase
MENGLTKEQEQKLREVLRGHPLEAMITLALATGMRRDELLSLKWEDIDLERYELRAWNSKTKGQFQQIHIPEAIVQLLVQHRTFQMEKRVEAGPAWQNLDLAFPNHTGGRLEPDQFLEDWYELLEQAALPRIRFHDLRSAARKALYE